MTQPHAIVSELVGPYRVLRAIGAGGSARIDLAVIERAYGFQRRVVLKRPLEHLRADPHVAATLRREASLGGQLRHPNLVAVLDAGTHDGYDYLALELVEGAALRTVMEAGTAPTVRALPLAAALSIIVGAARGLHHAHELVGPDGAPLGLVHRDVSPANILIDRDGAVKLSDFGIAKDTRVSTLSGSLRGTVTYMAPEQCRGHAFDRRADVFSLGVILHELITGRRLFWAENDVASLHKVLSGTLPDPRAIMPTLPAELCAIAMRALAREVPDRLATAEELAERLEAFAARAGLVLGARAVAPVLEPTGPSAKASRMMTAQLPVPVLPEEPAPVAPSLPRVQIDDEPSLVRVIEAAGGDDEELLPTFGPTASGDDEIATPVRQPTFVDATPRARRRWAIALVGAGAIAAGVITAVIATRGAHDSANGSAAITGAANDSAAITGAATGSAAGAATDSTAITGAATGSASPSQTTDLTRSDPARTDAARTVPARTDPAHSDPTSPTAPTDTRASATKPGKRRPPKVKPVDEPRDTTHVATPAEPAPEPPPPTTPSAGAGSGSAARPNVRWDERILLPTDKRPGAK